MTTAYQVKNDIHTAAASHVFEALQYLSTPIDTDMDEEQISDLIRSGLESYQYDGIALYYEAFLVVGSQEFNYDSDCDFTGCNSSLDCLMLEANELAYQAYDEALNSEIEEVVERITAIIEKALELDYEGAFQFSGSSIYGWEAHNYETDCGICIWSDEPGHYYANLLEGELWAIEGTVNGLTMGACWTPEKVAA